MDSESHDATKVTYALEDPRIYAICGEQAEPTENYDSAFLTFYKHCDDLEFFEEVIKPERFIQALDHAGFFNPYTMRVSKWYQKTTLKGDVSHFSPFSRTSDYRDVLAESYRPEKFGD